MKIRITDAAGKDYRYRFVEKYDTENETRERDGEPGGIPVHQGDGARRKSLGVVTYEDRGSKWARAVSMMVTVL